MKLLLIIGLAVISACSGGGWQALIVPATTMQGFEAEKARAKGKKEKGFTAGLGSKGPGSFIEKILHRKGLVFGTDGSAHSLHAYLAGRFPKLSPANAATGDIIAFDLGQGCGGHVGLVENVDSIGRIAFREFRGGSLQESLATPSLPSFRRDDEGRILNTFLKPRRINDPIGTRYFAGEMICAVFRVP